MFIIYLTLFTMALLSATFLPMGSEALLLYDYHLGFNIYHLLFVASLGNTLGSLINYLLGLKGTDYLLNKRWLKEKQIHNANMHFQKYGGFALLLSWVPLIGDPITFIAGVLHYPLWKFTLIVAIAKTTRYALLLFLI